MKKEDKGKVIKNLAETLGQYSNVYLTDIESLDAEETSKLRRECFKQEIKLIVVKNTLLKKAMESVDTDYSELYDVLKGNTAVMFANIANAPARLIKDFTKNTKGEGKPHLKGAYVQEGFYKAGDLDVLAMIKSKEELIGDVIGLLQSPMKNLISALQSNGGQKIHGILKSLKERK